MAYFFKLCYAWKVSGRTKTRKFSFYYKRSETKHDKSLSGWCPHGVHLWTKNKNQSLKHIHWFIAESFMGQYRATKDHRKIFCPAVFLWVCVDEAKLLNTIPARRLEFCVSPYIFPNTVDVFCIIALLKEFILNNSLKTQKQCHLKNCMFNI